MKKLYVISHVPATFVSSKMDVFNISNEEVNKTVEAPRWILETDLFAYLKQENLMVVADGELTIVESVENEEVNVEEPKEEENTEEEAKPQRSMRKKTS